MNTELENEKKAKVKHITTLIIGALLIVLTTGYFTYMWQQGEVRKLNERVKQLEQQSAQKKTSNNNRETEPTDEDITLYRNEQYDYSFSYPKVWQVSDAANEAGTAPGSQKPYSITIESPDLATSSGGIGFHLTAGARMYVSTYRTEAKTPDEVLGESEFMRRSTRDKKTTEVDGYNATQYTQVYESSPTLNLLVVKDGLKYIITLEYADEDALEKHKKDFELLVNSFNFLS